MATRSLAERWAHIAGFSCCNTYVCDCALSLLFVGLQSYYVIWMFMYDDTYLFTYPLNFMLREAAFIFAAQKPAACSKQWHTERWYVCVYDPHTTIRSLLNYHITTQLSDSRTTIRVPHNYTIPTQLSDPHTTIRYLHNSLNPTQLSYLQHNYHNPNNY